MPRYELAMITRIMSKVSLRDGCRLLRAKINGETCISVSMERTRGMAQGGK